MNTVGISNEEQKQIWSILSAILHLGNITFTAKGTDSSTPNTESLRWPASLLGVRLDFFLNFDFFFKEFRFKFSK